MWVFLSEKRHDKCELALPPQRENLQADKIGIFHDQSCQHAGDSTQVPKDTARVKFAIYFVNRGVKLLLSAWLLCCLKVSSMFDVRKATQVAAYLLWKRGGRMSYLKLMKMMYIAERQCLLQYGERLTGDKMVSMPRGPVLSETYDCFLEGRDYWNSWIKNPGNYDLALVDSVTVDPDDPLDTFDELSVAEKKVLDSVFDRFGNSKRWKLVKLLHDPEYCPEWENPNGSSYPIYVDSLLMKNGKSKRESDAILGKLRESDDLQAVTQRLS